MTTTAAPQTTTGTAAFAPVGAGLVGITFDGEIVATCKDGAGVVARVDRHLAHHGIYRTTGYSVQDGALVAAATKLS